MQFSRILTSLIFTLTLLVVVQAQAEIRVIAGCCSIIVAATNYGLIAANNQRTEFSSASTSYANLASITSLIVTGAVVTLNPEFGIACRNVIEQTRHAANYCSELFRRHRLRYTVNPPNPVQGTESITINVTQAPPPN